MSEIIPLRSITPAEACRYKEACGLMDMAKQYGVRVDGEMVQVAPLYDAFAARRLAACWQRIRPQSEVVFGVLAHGGEFMEVQND